MSHETATEPLRFETFEAYLEWEEQQPIRYELHDGQVVAMAGASEDHNTIADTVTFLLRMHYGLRSRCKVFRADMKLRVGELKNRYPDVLVACSEAAPQNRRFYDDARIVVEVISPDYAAKDLVSAPEAYIRLPHLEQYLVIDSRKRAAWSYVRQTDGQFVFVVAEHDRVEIPSEKLTFSFDDLYAGTTLDTTTS
jgi:Uma2 family endonuclease